jgi:two-component system sensor histidine kinase PilS (NtrC family)
VKWIGARNSREACLWLEHHWKTLGLNDISERDFSKKLHQIKFPRANIEGHVIRASFFDSKETPVDIYFIHDMSSYLNLRRETELNKRLASVGRLAAGIAHELRNPLAGISGSAQVLAKELSVKKNREDNEYSERLSEIIVSESDRMNRLIKDFLSFSKSSDARRTKVDLAQLIDQVFDQLRSQEDLPKDLSFHDIESESVWIYANEDHVKQILLNLYLNSIEALREKQGSKDIWTHVREDSEVVVLEIRDNGPGIPKEKQDRIFEPFFSTKESGTGLGLATVFQLMESNGGEISYNSSSHPSGACFILKFEEYKNEMASEVA